VGLWRLQIAVTPLNPPPPDRASCAAMPGAHALDMRSEPTVVGSTGWRTPGGICRHTLLLAAA
jgi:hypothetical protein